MTSIWREDGLHFVFVSIVFWKIGGADVDSSLSHDGRVPCIHLREHTRCDTVGNRHETNGGHQCYGADDDYQLIVVCFTYALGASSTVLKSIEEAGDRVHRSYSPQLPACACICDSERFRFVCPLLVLLLSLSNRLILEIALRSAPERSSLRRVVFTAPPPFAR